MAEARRQIIVRNRSESHAIILGAGICGLFAARIASDFFDRVTVIDRDDLDDPHGARRGLPQREHVHDFLIRGQQITEELFPGIADEMVAGGAFRGDLSQNARWIINGKPLPRTTAGLQIVTCTRPFRERYIRDRVRALPQVVLRGNTDVLRLVTSPDRRRVLGVTVQGDGEETLHADLVIDTTGRGSRAPVWLAELGYPRVEEEKRKIDIGYVTRYFRTPEDAFGGDISVNTVASPESPRGGSCQRVEGNRTLATAYGMLGNYPPEDLEGFRTFVKSLAAPDMYNIVKDAEPISEPLRYRFPANLRRHYQRMEDFPERFLVMGDAVCSINPRYGQGMTVSALQSLTLRQHLAKDTFPDPHSFFSDLADQVIDDVWDMTILSDLSIPGVEGERGPEVEKIIHHVGQVQQLATEDSDLALACLRVFGLLDSPATLLDPELLKTAGSEG